MERVRKKGGGRAEDQIQRAVFQHLKARAAPGVFAFHVPLGGYRKPKEAAIFKGLGVVSGVADVLAIKDGKTYALELKTEEGRVSTAQLATLEAMKLAGAIVHIAFGLDAALRWLEDMGILKGRAQA